MNLKNKTTQPNTNTNSETLDQLMRRLEEQGTQRTTQLMSSAYALSFDGKPSSDNPVGVPRRQPDTTAEQSNPRTPTPPSTSPAFFTNTTLENTLEKSILDTVKKIPQESILGIMKEGEDEFVKKTGRYMTYSEMRQLYG